MTITEIQSELTRRHDSFCDLMNTLTEKEFTFSSNGKWSAGQQLDHICRATSLLPMGLSLPSFVRRTLFGKPKRASRSYDELVKDYQSVLAGGGKASGIFIPKPVALSSREELVKKLTETVRKINGVVSKYGEEELDKTCLPHPLLGKLTLREMMLFTIYHVEHHHKLTKKYLEDLRTTSVSS